MRWDLPSGNVKIVMEDGAFIVDFPIENCDFFIAMLNYQRVQPMITPAVSDM